MKFAVAAILATVASLVAASPAPLEERAPAALEERSGVKISHATATSRLSAAGVTWSSSGNCSNRNNPTCTSFEQIYSGTIDGVITLRGAGACNCAIRVTGGTETGHASGTYSHWNGYKVDLAKSTALNNYITTRFARISNRSDGYPRWQSAAGNIYCDEGNHWDVIYY